MKATALNPRRHRVVQVDGPDPIDIHVGRRLRELRLQRGISLVELGRRIGVSFQAVQKYESASMRISASTLYRMAQVFAVGPGYFFEGYAAPKAAITTRRPKQRSAAGSHEPIS
jgi:transcriptional regulator with XRE-family HTH domain